MRGIVGFVIFLALSLIIYGATTLEFEMGTSKFVEFIQIMEAGINDLIPIGASISFLISLESRRKRIKAIESLNELRAVAHVIDCIS